MAYKNNTSGVPIKSLPQDERLLKLNQTFAEEFKKNPCFFVRVPGRVNIIGEHIDYCGYPVLPMALEQDILIAAGKTDKSRLHIRNMDKKYLPFEYTVENNREIEINPDSKGKPFWYNYVLCGIKGAIEYIGDKAVNGLQIIVDGNIPPASGLSSSSALVSAACLSFLFANNVNITKFDIASLCAKSERYIGTQGGGMDQAIAFLAEKYCAQYITWNPLKASAVTLPEDVVFVVAHSLAEANKAATNDFNTRVMECRLAAKILATKTNAIADTKIFSLSEVQYILGNSLQEMVDLVLLHLPQDVYTKSEICDMLHINEEDLNMSYLTNNTRHIKEFKLKQRALHVFQEAMRVEQFRETCLKSTGHGDILINGTNGNSNNTTFDSKKAFEMLGSLMSDSHESLKNLYECSHTNLDRLVDISNDMNIHSRLTGAGWGGCIVALCSKDKVEKYIEELVEKFYVQHCNVDKNIARNYVFATTPNYGAIIYADES